MTQTRRIPIGPADAPGRRLAYAGLTIALLALGNVTGMLSIFRDALQSHLGISIDRYGLLLSIGSVPGIFGALLAGRIVDRQGPRPVLRGCLLGAAVGMAAVGVADRWLFLLAAVGAIGLFMAPLHVAVQAYLVRLFPLHRRRVLSLSLVAVGIAGMGFPLLAEGLLHLQRASPAVSFGQVLHVPFLGVAGVLAAGALLYRRRSSGGLPAAAAAREDSLPHRRGRGAWLLIGLMALHGACDMSAHLWLPRVLDSASYVRRVFVPGAVMAAYSLAYVLSRGVLALLPERWGRRFMIVAPGLLGGGAFLAGVLARSQAAAAAGYVLGALCWSIEYPALLATLAGDGQRRFGTALGALAVASGLATFALANLMGLIARALPESSLWVILLLPAAGFAVVGAGGAAWIWRFGRGGQDRSPASGGEPG